QLVLHPPIHVVATRQLRARRLRRQMLDTHPDHAERQPAAALRIEPPPVPHVDVVEARQVGLHRIPVFTKKTAEASYSPAALKPAATAIASISPATDFTDHFPSWDLRYEALTSSY